MPDLSQELRTALESLETISKNLENLNDLPSTAVPTKTAAESPTETPTYMSRSDMWEVRRELAKKSTAELHMMFAIQANKSGSGIPFGVWAATGGNPVQSAIEGDAMLRKALDSGSASGQALIRQDLEPIMYELFVRQFPAFDQFRKEPANGLVHAFNRMTSFGDAQFMSELGTVTDDSSVYERATTNVAILATRRGISLKEQFAALQSGGGFNPENLELSGGMRSIAHKMQKTIFQGNASYAGYAATDEQGAFDANSFTGLRAILDTARAVDVDPTAGTPENIRQAIDNALLEAMNNGGSVNTIYLRPQEQIAFDFQQDANVRYINDLGRVQAGVNVETVNTIFGPLGLNVVPGDSIGHYTRSFDVADIYLLDSTTISLPYLGSPGPTVLDIPVGISGQLTHLFIIFGMWGLAVKAPIFSNKVRVKQ